MTQADFYILAAQHSQEQMLFTCRLLEKAVANNNRVLIQTNNEAEAKQIDDLIWNFRPETFIPHSLINSAEAEHCAVNIGWQDNPGNHHDIIINLSAEIPPFYSRFLRYITVVVQQDQVLTQTRAHYRFLKDRGYQIRTHDMRIR